MQRGVDPLESALTANNTWIEKINPMTIGYFSTDQGAVVTHILDKCITTGTVYIIVNHIHEDIVTAELIFLDEVLKDHGVPWQNCVDVGVTIRGSI